jgi:flavin-binding protein dodecin
LAKKIHKGESETGFDEAAREAIRTVEGKPVSFKVTEFSGTVSPNPGKINKFSVTLEVTTDP